MIHVVCDIIYDIHVVCDIIYDIHVVCDIIYDIHVVCDIIWDIMCDMCRKELVIDSCKGSDLLR